MTRLPMDPAQKFNPTWTPESSQMPTEENSWLGTGAHACNPGIERELTDPGLKGVRNESRNEPFKYGCSYCLYHRQEPSESARMENIMTQPI
ncbi:developmental pluripotency-associated protein 3 [Lemur catta]|uniref:developmental pluripotency-associated protein 3 n=1 Tax=Lemur catta TaxID=9447 RepID=UPI001E26DDB1|nr:developmental pluripotency-associated protein 3 [Lemur catta]